jgi:O-Antigen ligase
MTIYTIKRLIVVLTIAALVFHLAKPIALRFMNAEDFARRRRVWFVLTAVSFISPSFWLYALVAVPIFLWASRRDTNPIALYLLMMHVIPPVGFIIPILGNNGLFPLDNYRLLAFTVLLPATLRYRKNREAAALVPFGPMDFLLLAYGALQIALYLPPDIPHQLPLSDSLSNVLRRAFLFFLDTYLLYFTVSRTCQSRRKLVDAAATFCLACALMAPIAMFENLRNWLLYVEIESVWGLPLNAFTWLSRGGELRAQASAGHPLALGYLLAVGFAFWLYLRSHVKSRIRRIGVTLSLWGGLFAAYSRGPWLGAVIAYFTFFAAGPSAVSRLAKGALIAFVAALLIMMSPIGDRILSVLPVMGNTADANIIYRQRLSERGWEIVLSHPFFGDQYPYPEMEDLRQGEGIIDLVNTYLGVALGYGLIGLFCFLSFILIGMTTVYARTRVVVHTDPDLAMFGTSLIACIVGTLVMIDSNSFNLGCEKMFYVLAGLSAAYARLTRSPQSRLAALAARNAQQE